MRSFLAIAAVACTLGSLPAEPFTGRAFAQASFMGESFTCETAEANVARLINNTQPPSSAGLVTQMQHLMWMLEQGIGWLDGNCSGEMGYSQTRASWQNSLNATVNACRNIASNSGDCYARRYQ